MSIIYYYSIDISNKKNAQSAGFEPARAEPNGFLVHRLNHSATTALDVARNHTTRPSNEQVMGPYSKWRSQRGGHALQTFGDSLFLQLIYVVAFF